MEAPIYGEVVCVEVPNPRSVQRFVSKRIAQWVALHNQSAERVKTYFFVKFEKIGAGHQIFCTIQLMIGNRVWKGTALAGGLHRALIRSMDHLNLRFENIEGAMQMKAAAGL